MEPARSGERVLPAPGRQRGGPQLHRSGLARPRRAARLLGRAAPLAAGAPSRRGALERQADPARAEPRRGDDRRADRHAQPACAVRRRCAAARLAPRGVIAVARDLRPRRLQAVQRQLRPSRGRRAARPPGPPDAAGRRRPWRGLPDGRRRVLRDHRRRRRGARARRGRRVAERARRAVRDRLLVRRRLDPGRRAVDRARAPARRRAPVRQQGAATLVAAGADQGCARSRCWPSRATIS